MHIFIERETSGYEAGDDTHLFITNMLFCYLEVSSSLYVNFQMKYLENLHKMDETTITLKNFIS